MSATARDLSSGTAMDETVVFEADAPSGPRPEAADAPEAPAPAAEPGRRSPAQPPGAHRYTYSSGARPLDGYTVKRAVGRGGFGEVYYATSDSGKEVALKLIMRNLDVERRGVVQCMNLKHPNLLTVYDLRSDGSGETFVIMEYVAGPSLAHVLAEHPHGLPAAEARAWLKGLVEGVAYLHDHGVVHRDLKPANLFMEEGVVKIGDYGLAKLIAPGRGSEHSESIGTCHYMAPEIASGRYHTPIDIYAIGVILVEMLTGRVPFEGETVGEVLMKHLTARPDVSALPEPYRSIAARALAKDPEHRPRRAYDLLPPDDAPAAPAVRFIGGGGAAAVTPGPPRANAAASPSPKDDVLRIGAEEPVFYIGPDTNPPRPPLHQRLRAAWPRAARAGRAAAPPRDRRRNQAPGPVPVPFPARASTPTPVPFPPPTPAKAPPRAPALPAARARVAELSASMLAAALFTAVMAYPTALALGVDVPGRPEQLAFLGGLSLLGTWAVLVPSRLAEGRRLGPPARRACLFAGGAAVGLLGAGLASWVELGALPVWVHGVRSFDPRWLAAAGPNGRPSVLVYAAYFGLLGLVGGWPALGSRGRKTRLRVGPTLRAGGAAWLLSLALPFPGTWGLGVAGLTAVVTQLVSPWSEEAASYARYAAKAGRRCRVA